VSSAANGIWNAELFTPLVLKDMEWCSVRMNPPKTKEAPAID